MTWAVFIDTDGKPKVDHYAFARLGRLISEHANRKGDDGADAALAAYLKRQEREAAEAAGQKELFEPSPPGADQRSGGTRPGGGGRR